MDKQEAIQQLCLLQAENFISNEKKSAIGVGISALEHQKKLEQEALVQMHKKCVLGKDEMYAKSTLQSMSKDELIQLLFIAQHNYSVVLEEYDNRINYYENEIAKQAVNAPKKPINDLVKTETEWDSNSVYVYVCHNDKKVLWPLEEYMDYRACSVGYNSYADLIDHDMVISLPDELFSHKGELLKLTPEQKQEITDWLFYKSKDDEKYYE